MDTTELGRLMMSRAHELDDDKEFNSWTRLAPVLIGLDRNKRRILTPEEQQVVARAMIKLSPAKNKSVA
jgi:hypothetical protein